MSFEPFSNVTDANWEQPWNAHSSILSTLAGISIEVNAVQSENAPKWAWAPDESKDTGKIKFIPPIVLSFEPFSNVTDANWEHPLNAHSSILSTLAGISIEVIGQSENTPCQWVAGYRFST